MLVSSFKNGFKKGDFFRLLGMLVLVLIMPLVNYLFSNGIYLYITKNLADKYDHLETTQELLSKGETLKACEYAEKAYTQEMTKTGISSFFFLSRIYASTRIDRAHRLTKRYGATIAYAHCLKSSGGSSKEAKDLFEDAVELSDSELLQGQQESFLSYPLLSLAEINLQEGKYYKAEQYFEQLQDLLGQLSSEDVSYQLQGRMMFSDRALRVGDFQKAARINLENVALYERSGLSMESQSYCGLLLVAALSEMHLENFRSAKDLLIRAQPIAVEHENGPLYPNFLMAKADFLFRAAQKDFDASELITTSWWDKLTNSFEEDLPLHQSLLEEAQRSYRLALEEVVEKAGKNSYQYVTMLRRVADFYYEMGEYGQAEEKYNEALEILRPIKSEHKDLYNDILIASLKTTEGINYDLLDGVEDQIFQQLTANYLFLTEEEKETFVSRVEDRMQVLNGLYLRENTPRSNERLYNNVLATKQLALNSNSHLRRYISGVPGNLKTEYHSLLKQKEEILSVTDVERRNTLTAEITEKERLLKSRIRDDASFSPFQPNATQWQQVRNALEENEVAIEVFHLSLSSSSGQDEEDLYFALLLKNDFEYPRLIPLFKGKDLEYFMNKSGGIRERVNLIYASEKEELLDIVWNPISHELENASAVYLSLSGLLHEVSFPALMLDQPFEMHLLGSTRDLIIPTHAKRQEKKNRIALFGDAAFGSIKESDVRSFSTIDNKIIQGLKSGFFSDLQYTKQEVDTIEKIFISAKGTVSKWTGKSASEKSFRDLDKNNFNLIHLATHGFYFKKNTPMFSGTVDMMNQNPLEDNSMFRSGILLSRDDVHETGKNNDGILTAFELSKMDLSGVDLMVLSACETARGDISGGEGVFGLQRALKLAGVKDQIVSLWQVPDKETSTLFKNFYENLIAGSSPYNSLKIAQREMALEYSPFYWAGFVLLE